VISGDLIFFHLSHPALDPLLEFIIKLNFRICFVTFFFFLKKKKKKNFLTYLFLTYLHVHLRASMQTGLHSFLCLLIISHLNKKRKKKKNEEVELQQGSVFLLEKLFSISSASVYFLKKFSQKSRYLDTSSHVMVLIIMTIGLNIDFIGQKIQVKMSKKGNLVEK
jgi:Ca2+/Na+ antiporter